MTRVALLLLCLVFLPGTLKAGPAGKAPDCAECHTCEAPTPREACLSHCPRDQKPRASGAHTLSEAPRDFNIGEISNLFPSVRFGHQLHAGMAQMGGDCATCHHFSPEGKIPPCSECHGGKKSVSNFRLPSLKGAFHRQCLACHREWSHLSKCSVCHTTKVEGTFTDMPDTTDIIGSPHPNIAVPDKKVYTTPYETKPVVTFHHKQHVELFGLKCVDCHKEERCQNCHEADQNKRRVRTDVEIHAVCKDCHEEDRCAKCHSTKEMAAFTHVNTGWPLSIYHRRLQCSNCHDSTKVVARLSTDCIKCHPGWKKDKFNHERVGLQLNEDHEEPCSECHIDWNFTKKPRCEGCHEGESMNYLEAPPGKYIKR